MRVDSTDEFMGRMNLREKNQLKGRFKVQSLGVGFVNLRKKINLRVDSRFNMRVD